MTDELINSSEVANLESTGATPDGQQVQAAIPDPAIAPSETLYDVKVNGQTIKVPLSELTGGYSRQQDYTRKSQEVADYRRQIDAEVNQYRTQLGEVQRFLNDERVKQALSGLQAGVTDPKSPLTMEQAQQLYAQQQQQSQSANEQRMQSMMQELEVKTLAAQYSREIESTISQIKQKHPVLADIDGFEYSLRQKVGEAQPQSLEDAKKLFNDLASATAQRLESRFQTQQKQAAVTQQQLVKGGIEPPGGTAATVIQPPSNFKIGSKDLLAQALQDMIADTK